MSISSDLNAISLFSGCGGDSLGMQQAGLKLVAYNEKIKQFQETHDINFPNCKLLGNDITKVTDEEFLKSVLIHHPILTLQFLYLNQLLGLL